ncbi:type II secretion system F family protein [Arthrobacter sp. 35W]|uniref:type II secretion system F family protein n=1 Tax=Arthrobacter sp. 35W TaxID=1132441 RepID=UPI000416DA71|nr:type II secretion system F family protein [Arthrobacter sp. 35W]
MSGELFAAVTAGLVLGAGLWLVLVRLPFMRRPTFAERIEPQLRSVAPQSRLLAESDGPTVLFGPLERLLRAILADAAGQLGRFNIGTTALTLRLQQAGRRQTALEFRATQLLWAAGGFAVATVAVLMAAAVGRLNVPLAVTGVIGLSVGGYLFKDYLLSAAIRRRHGRMLAEFPSLAELMALAVSAGESATGALERVCRSSRGDLSTEFGMVLAQMRSGTPLIEALEQFSHRNRVPALMRFVDGISVAVQRGTPLADVLRAQAQDVRDMAKRELMESAGKKEIGMMVPLVFGILPLTVVFAVFPGFAALSLGF